MAPRAAAVFGGTVAFVFLAYSGLLIFEDTKAGDSVPFLLLLPVPEIAAILVSGIAFRTKRESL